MVYGLLVVGQGIFCLVSRGGDFAGYGGAVRGGCSQSQLLSVGAGYLAYWLAMV